MRLDSLVQERKLLIQVLSPASDASIKILDENADKIKTLVLILEASLKGLKVQASLSGSEQEPEFTSLIAQFEQAQVKLLSLQLNERNKPDQLYNTQALFKSAQIPDDPHKNTNPGQPDLGP